ncbi:MAG: acetate--CoA ligase family protein [Smithellaceae bacterium]|nr:acetate--CoA ligase family protein [Smithellaceae bacterium]
MTTINLLEKAGKEGRNTLTEAEAKQLLSNYGVPVVKDSLAFSLDEVIEKAREVGFPLVIKALGARITHKTERGLVRLNINSANELKAAAREIQEAAGEDLEGFILQPMLRGRREFLAGLFRDRQFGPVVMFGLGGVLTEALDDVVFRVAPLDESQAAHMLEEIRAGGLLDEFRGEKAAERQSLINTLVGLSRLGMENDQIAEVDINPLLVGPDGTVTAVDALVVLGEPREPAEERPAIEPRAIRNLFYPRSIAFIGASASFGKWGNMLFTNAVAGNFQGDIYLVNQKGGVIAGRPVYKSILDIPGSVDLAVVTVPAASVLDLIPELQQKAIKNMLLITSGFSETGEKGIRLEKELVRAARAAGILLLGPNTMGICNPHDLLYCTGTHVRPKPGSTALVSQSGNLGTQLLAFAQQEGIGIRAFCGSGNEAMITIEDYLEGFEVDELTDTVVLYLESIKNGRRFIEAARRVGKKKPVVVLKGGRTKAGFRAAASHTGALASNLKIFTAACRQSGIIMVEQPMELLDLSAVFSSLPLPKGRRVGILTMGGGWGVVAADLCMEYGLEVPELSADIITRINQFLPAYWSHSNPIDLVAEFNHNISASIIEELLKWDQCDAVIHMGILGQLSFVKFMISSTRIADPTFDTETLDKIPGVLGGYELQYIERITRMMEKYQKPVMAVNLFAEENVHTVTDVKDCRFKGISFSTPERAVKALARMYEYERWLDREGVPAAERRSTGVSWQSS